MSGDLIRLSKSSISEAEKSAVLNVLDKEYLGMGEEVQLFEVELKHYLKTQAEVVCVNTGTSALHLSLAALGIGLGDEVLTPSLTYLASFQAISATGAIPVSCDVHEKTGFIDLQDATTRLSNRTRAIMPVHYASNTVGMKEVYAFAKKHGLRIIEDAAHSFGGFYEDGVKVGQQGDIVCFSFDGIKNITSGEGGAVVSCDTEVMSKIQDMRLLAVEKDTDKRYSGKRSWDFDVKLQGYRYHMSNIMAAIGRAQLTRVNGFINRRQDIIRRYLNNLQIDNISFFEFDYEYIVPHIVVAKATRRSELRKYMLEKGIETGIHYKPNHLLSKYKTTYVLPVAERLGGNIITLPCHNDLTQVDQDYVIESIKEFYCG